ncbi:MAG: IS630 transposase-related protein [Chitinispirillia bacterium]|nr:IS630 transposase-related protein [Chitinispirillia bacterium]
MSPFLNVIIINPYHGNPTRMAYNKEFRTKIVQHFLAGSTREELSALFNVSISAITKWTAIYRESGTPGGGYKKNWSTGKRIKMIDPKELETYLKTHPGATSREISDAFSCSFETARKALLGIKHTNTHRQKAAEEESVFFSDYPKFYFER